MEQGTDARQNQQVYDRVPPGPLARIGGPVGGLLCRSCGVRPASTVLNPHTQRGQWCTYCARTLKGDYSHPKMLRHLILSFLSYIDADTRYSPEPASQALYARCQSALSYFADLDSKVYLMSYILRMRTVPTWNYAGYFKDFWSVLDFILDADNKTKSSPAIYFRPEDILLFWTTAHHEAYVNMDPDTNATFTSKAAIPQSAAEACLYHDVCALFPGEHVYGQSQQLGWILDIYIPGLDLAIELDGDSHDSLYAEISDDYRDWCFLYYFHPGNPSRKIKTLRFAKSDYLRNPAEVIEDIKTQAALWQIECGHINAPDDPLVFAPLIPFQSPGSAYQTKRKTRPCMETSTLK